MFKNLFNKYDKELVRNVEAFIEDCRFEAYHNLLGGTGAVSCMVLQEEEGVILLHFKDTYTNLETFRSRLPEISYGRLKKACNYYLTCLEDYEKEQERKSNPEAEDNNKNLRKLIEELRVARTEGDFSKIDVVSEARVSAVGDKTGISTEYSIVDVATGNKYLLDSFRWRFACDNELVKDLEGLCENIIEDRRCKRKVNIAGLRFTYE